MGRAQRPLHERARLVHQRRDPHARGGRRSRPRRAAPAPARATAGRHRARGRARRRPRRRRRGWGLRSCAQGRRAPLRCADGRASAPRPSDSTRRCRGPCAAAGRRRCCRLRAARAPRSRAAARRWAAPARRTKTNVWLGSLSSSRRVVTAARLRPPSFSGRSRPSAPSSPIATGTCRGSFVSWPGVRGQALRERRGDRSLRTRRIRPWR